MYTTTQVPQTLNYSISKDDWALKTALADSIARCFPYLNNKGIPNQIRDCGKTLSFQYVCDQGASYLIDANWCQRPLCPTCDRRLAKQREFLLDTAIKRMALEGTQFVFLTLTQENCKPEELVEVTDNMTGRKSFQKIGAWHVIENTILRGELAPVVKGWVWKWEVTYNQKADTFHPHMHILIAVTDDYFPTITEHGYDEGDYYRRQPWWCDVWNQAMSLTREPIVYIKKSDLRIAHEVTKPEIVHEDLIFPDNPDLTDHIIKRVFPAVALHTTFGVEGELGEVYREVYSQTKAFKDHPAIV